MEFSKVVEFKECHNDRNESNFTNSVDMECLGNFRGGSQSIKMKVNSHFLHLEKLNYSLYFFATSPSTYAQHLWIPLSKMQKDCMF